MGVLNAGCWLMSAMGGGAIRFGGNICPLTLSGGRGMLCSANMNTQVLIDQIVRQTMILIAQLATSGGARAPLAHIADRVFIELARELEAQGLSKTVSADMFGVAMRTYRRRIQRVSESATDQGRSLWNAVLDFVPSDRLVTRGEILHRFRLDDESQVRGILTDLCDSGLLLRLGRGTTTAYRAATSKELSELEGTTDGLEQLLWLLIYRDGPSTRDQLAEQARAEAERIDSALDSLTASHRVQLLGDHYSTSEVVVSQQQPAGWEAAMLDHFQAMVNTLCTRLRGAADSEANGGSTYSFDMAPDHPLAEDVYGVLSRYRRELTALRARVEKYNAEHPTAKVPDLVTVYVGQHVRTEENE
jgi:hypothetical protein